MARQPPTTALPDLCHAKSHFPVRCWFVPRLKVQPLIIVGESICPTGLWQTCPRSRASSAKRRVPRKTRGFLGTHAQSWRARVAALSVIYSRRDRAARRASLTCKVANVGCTFRRRRDRRDGIEVYRGASLAEIHTNRRSAFYFICLEPCLHLAAIFQRTLAPQSHQFGLLLLRRGGGPGEHGWPQSRP